MMDSADRDADGLVHAALAQATLISDDPAFREWCYAYRAGSNVGLSEHAALKALASVWPELSTWPLEEALQRMEADGRGAVCPQAAARWATGGAARAAWELVWTRHIGGEIGAQRLDRIGVMARESMVFAERARAQRPPAALPPVSRKGATDTGLSGAVSAPHSVVSGIGCARPAMAPVGTVLVVDDEFGVRESLRLCFEQLGVTTICAANGDHALALLDRSERPRLIVLDIMMPGMDGWEFRKRQREDRKLAAIPVVVVTALDDASAITQRLGAVATLRKPIELEQLRTLVERYCR